MDKTTRRRSSASPSRRTQPRLSSVVTIVVAVAGEGTLRADVRKLALAMSNLVDNAIKYGKKGGRVTVSGKIEPSGCTLEVKDDGPGIPKEKLPYLFERRSGAHHADGLALSLVRDIVAAHGGRIEVESRTGADEHGTSIAMRLPCSR